MLEEEMNEGGMSLEVEISGAEEADEGMFAEMSPEGRFSQKQLNNLVKATNRLLPAFGQEPDYPEFAEDITKFPTDFTRIIAMFQGAITQAAEMDAMEMDFDLTSLTDDAGLMALAGKLTSLAKSRDFKQFLKNPPVEEEEEEMEEAGPVQPSEEEIDAMFASRM
mgnify:CR=1 FL=1